MLPVQLELNSIHRWRKNNTMQINVGKYQALRYHRSKLNVNLTTYPGTQGITIPEFRSKQNFSIDMIDHSCSQAQISQMVSKFRWVTGSENLQNRRERNHDGLLEVIRPQPTRL